MYFILNDTSPLLSKTLHTLCIVNKSSYGIFPLRCSETSNIVSPVLSDQIVFNLSSKLYQINFTSYHVCRLYLYFSTMF